MSSLVSNSFKPTLELNDNFENLKQLSKKIAILKYKFDNTLLILKNCKICWDNMENDLKNNWKIIEKLKEEKKSFLKDKHFNNDISKYLYSTENEYTYNINFFINRIKPLELGLIITTCKKHFKIKKKLKKMKLLIEEYEKLIDKFNIHSI